MLMTYSRCNGMFRAWMERYATGVKQFRRLVKSMEFPFGIWRHNSYINVRCRTASCVVNKFHKIITDEWSIVALRMYFFLLLKLSIFLIIPVSFRDSAFNFIQVWKFFVTVLHRKQVIRMRRRWLSTCYYWSTTMTFRPHSLQPLRSLLIIASCFFLMQLFIGVFLFCNLYLNIVKSFYLMFLDF